MATEQSLQSRARLPHAPALDGLRGVLVIFILFFHGGFEWASGGFLSVSAFFVLSGYLITSLLLVEFDGHGRISLARFWERRFRRLLPTALMGIALATAYSHFEGDAGQLARLRADGLSALGYVANWRFFLSGLNYEDVFARPSPLQHYWSLSIEEQFYLLFPAFLGSALVRTGGRRCALIVGMAGLGFGSSLLMAGLFVPELPTARVYYGSDTRFAELAIGVLLALGFTRGGRTRIGGGTALQIAAFAATPPILAFWHLASVGTPALYRGGFALHALLCSVVIAASVEEGPYSRMLSWRPLQLLGRISYGTYVYHWPIFLWLDSTFTSLGVAPLFMLQASASLGVALVLHSLVEEPIRRGRALPGHRAWVGALTAFAAVAGALLYVTHDPPEPWFFESRLNRTAAMPEVPDDGSGPPRILIVGDSLAKSLGVGLARRAEAHGMSAWNIAVMGCGIARRGERVFVQGSPAGRDLCMSWADWWPVQRDRFKPDYAVIIGGPRDLVTRRLPEWSEFRNLGDPIFDDWLVSEYVEAVDVLSARGAHVLWLSNPCVSPMRESMSLPAEAFSPEKTRYVNERIVPRILDARPAKVTFLDLYSQVCEDGRPIQDMGGRERLRPDGLHFSIPGASRVADWLLDEIEALPGPERLGRRAGASP